MYCKSLILISVCIVPMQLAAEEVVSDVARIRVNDFLQILAEARADGEPLAQDNLDSYTASLSELVKKRPVVHLRAENWSVDAVGDTGEVYCYSRKAMFYEEKDRAETLTRAESLSLEAAFKIFLPLAACFDQPLTKEDYDVRFVDYQAHEKETLPEHERNLAGCVWEIRRNFTFKGVPCPDRQLAVMISATSGRVSLVVNKPVVVPEGEGKNVTREQALEIASSWFARQPNVTNARGRNARIREGTLKKTQWVIACPNPFLGGTQSSAERYVGPVAYYCWEVPFEYEVIGDQQPELINAVVWVDADGGAVIGGKDVRP